MKRFFACVLSFLLAALLFAGCQSEAGSSGGENAIGNGQLNLYTWEGMFPQEVLEGFSKETGVKINYVNFDTDETMLSKLEAAEGGDYDLVIADDYIIETAISEGLAQKLDTARLENFKNINPIYQGQFYDPQDEYTVPYGAGVQTIVYDPARVDFTITGYEDLWDQSLKGEVGITSNTRVIDGMALKVLGESYNTEDPEKIRTAGEKLLELAPNIRLIKDDNLQDDLIAGEVSVAVMYTSQVTTAKIAEPGLQIVYPREGIGFGVMAQFIPSKAPNAEAAYQFIDYILRPEISAQCFEYMGYYCTNKEADSLISEEYREFLTLPGEFKAEDMEMIGNISAEAWDEHMKVWNEFKAACE